MKKFIRKILNKVGSQLTFSEKILLEKTAILSAKQLALAYQALPSVTDLASTEFRVFSQNGEDGILEWLVAKLPMIPHTFIEFGVENYLESNTRFLLMNRNWRGLVIDGSKENIDFIKNQSLYWQHDLTAVSSFITAENINTIFKDNNFIGDIGILSVDIDGNDYWVWEAIDVINPAIVVVEYSAVLGDIYPLSIPYQADFYRFNAHYSGQYAGASIAAFNYLAEQKGYQLLGTNSTGVNAFYIRNDLFPILADLIENITIHPARFSDARNEQGQLTFLRGDQRKKLIENLPVVDVETSQKKILAQYDNLYSEKWQKGIVIKQE